MGCVERTRDSFGIVVGRTVFRIPEWPDRLYATRAFAEAALAAGRRGMIFAPVASV
jgi:hypothetical protein